MGTFVAVLHILVALVLIALVLIQDSKGGGALGIGGGATSNSVLGATGASTLAAKMTRIAAIIFALTSIGLTVISARESRSVLDSVPVNSAAPAPAPVNPVAPVAPVTAPATNSAPADSQPTAPTTK